MVKLGAAITKGADTTAALAGVLTTIVLAAANLGALVPTAALLTIKGLLPYIGYIGARASLPWPCAEDSARTAAAIRFTWKTLAGFDKGGGISASSCRIVTPSDADSPTHSLERHVGHPDRHDPSCMECT
jgi:hypothetical protein